MKPTLLTIFGLCFFLNAFSQEEQEPLTSDRPGTTNSADIIPKGSIQGQHGIQLSRLSTEFYNDDSRVLSNQIRFGILNSTEIIANIDYSYFRFEGKQTNTINEEEYLSKIGVGIRQGIINETQYLPRIGILVNANLLDGFNGNFRIEDDEVPVQLAFIALFQKNLSNKLGLSSNLGIEGYQGFEFYYWFFTLNIGYNFTNRISAFGEYQHYNQDWFTLNAVNTGIAFQINNSFLIDAYIGLGQNTSDELRLIRFSQNSYEDIKFEEFYSSINLGITYRIN